MDTDTDLVNAALAGDKSAFGELVLRHQGNIYRFVYRIINNSFDTADIVQETFISAYQNLRKLRYKDKFSAWLCKIAKNQCLMWVRDRVTIEDLGSCQPPTPEEIMIERELYENVMRAISRLPAHNRRAVEMFYLEGMSYSDIQKELGITKGTLGRWLHEARIELCKNIQKAYQCIVFMANALKPARTFISTSAVSVTKCLIISLVLHTLIFLQPSIIGINWSGSNGNVKSGGLFIEAFLTEITDSVPIPVLSKDAMPKSGLRAANSVKAFGNKSFRNTEFKPAKLKLPVSNGSVQNKGYDRAADMINISIPIKELSRDFKYFGSESGHKEETRKQDPVEGKQDLLMAESIMPESDNQLDLNDEVEQPDQDIPMNQEYALSHTWQNKLHIVPRDMAIDNYGNLYISGGDNSVYKYNPDGELVLKLGSKGAAPGYFSNPGGISADDNGYVYVADGNNYRIQKFSQHGMFIAEWGKRGSGKGMFKDPRDVAVDRSGHIYAIDFRNNCVQKFNSKGLMMTMWGQNGSSDGYFRSPTDIAVDKIGLVYVVDHGNKRIQVFRSDGEFYAKIKIDALQGFSSDIAVDSWEGIFVANPREHCVQKYGINGRLIATLELKISDGDQLASSIPTSVALDNSGNVFVGSLDKSIRIFTPSKKQQEYAFQRSMNITNVGGIEYISIDNSCCIYITDVAASIIRKYSPEGEFIYKFGGSGKANRQFQQPRGIVVDQMGNIYVADCGNNRIQKLDPEGDFISKWGTYGNGDGQFNNPRHVAIDSSGNIYVTDTGNNRIQKFSPNGRFLSKFGEKGNQDGQFNSPGGIAFDAQGNIYVADTGNNRVQKFDQYGAFLAQCGVKGSGDGEFNQPSSVSVDESGNILVADTYNHRIQKFTPDGDFICKWGSPGIGDNQFFAPAFAMPDSSGNIYVSDMGSRKIKVFRQVRENWN